MKRILLPLFMVLSFAPSQAQNTDDDNMHPSMVKWSDRKLRWDDFKGTKPMLSDDDDIAHLSLYLESKECTKKVDGIVYKYYGYDTYMDQKESWIAHQNRSESVLKHYQNQFDLWECLAREYINGVTVVNSFSRVREQFDKEAKVMNKKTNNGEKKAMVDSIADYLADRLHGIELDPITIVADYVDDKWAYAFNFGFSSHFPLDTEYQKSSYGFCVGYDIFIKKFVFGMDFDAEFGSKCRKTIHADKGDVEVGDKLENGGLTVFGGYNVINGRSFALTPYANLGVRFMNGGEKYKEENNKYIVINGFTAGIGVMADFIIRRTINMRTIFWSVSKSEQSIRVKPYLSFSNYPHGIDWIPEFNISVAYNIKTGGMKKRRSLIY
jgi:hypothetical protein